jgi:hypothetical protein
MGELINAPPAVRVQGWAHCLTFRRNRVLPVRDPAHRINVAHLGSWFVYRIGYVDIGIYVQLGYGKTGVLSREGRTLVLLCPRQRAIIVIDPLVACRLFRLTPPT